MNSRLAFRIKAWLTYFISARTIHQVDSPFIFGFCKAVIENTDHLIDQEAIEKLRKELLSDKSVFNRLDLGAGPARGSQARQSIGHFIKQSSVKPDDGKLMNRVARFWDPSVILELGTAGGVSGAYWLAGRPQSILKTIEGDPVVAALARNNFNRLGLYSAEVIDGNFETVLPGLLTQLKSIDLVFIDGHHTGEALLRYIDIISPYLNPHHGVMVLDDIHWSRDMSNAWEKLKSNSDWPLSIDLFQLGLLIKNPDLIRHENISLIAARYKPWILGLFR
jgi:predicted O-methyltransferase YrrM